MKDRPIITIQSTGSGAQVSWENFAGKFKIETPTGPVTLGGEDLLWHLSLHGMRSLFVMLREEHKSGCRQDCAKVQMANEVVAFIDALP